MELGGFIHLMLALKSSNSISQATIQATFRVLVSTMHMTVAVEPLFDFSEHIHFMVVRENRLELFLKLL